MQGLVGALAALAALAAAPAGAVEFEPLADLQTGIGFTTVLALGPEDPDGASSGDGCIYAANGHTGAVHRICFDATKSVTSDTVVVDLNGGEDVGNVQGIAFDPASDPATEIHLYIGYALGPDAPLNGRVARAVSTDAGVSYSVDEAFIKGLVRASFAISHQTNGLDFGPDGCLYIAQGAPSNAGYDSIRAESRLSGAILRACFKDASGGVDPAFDRDCGEGNTQQACDVEVFAAGLRNPYDLVWHSNGQLYSTDNDANRNFRNDCGAEFNNFGCPCQANTVEPLGDELNLIEEGRYYGSPNPYRAHPSALQCQGGTAGGKACSGSADCDGGGSCADLSSLCIDAVCGESAQCFYFGWGEPPEAGEDPNGLYEEPIAQIAARLDGIAEYKSRFDDRFPGSFCSDWNGQLLATGAPGDVRRFSLSADGRSAMHQGTGNLNGASGLDITVGPDGTVYVANLSAGKVTYLVPIKQSDPEAANLFRFCDVSLEEGAWDVPGAPASPPVGRSDYAAAQLEIAGSRYLFVLGQAGTSEVLRYDPATNAWASSSDPGTPGVPPNPPFPLTGPPTSGHKAAVGIGGAIYVIGGLDPFDNNTWLYDGVNDPTPNQLSHIGCNGSSQNCRGPDQIGTIGSNGLRLGAAAAAAMDDRIYIAGGLCRTTGAGAADCTCGGVPSGTAGNCAGNLAPGQNTDRAFRYEIETDDWFEIASMPLAVDHAAGAAFAGRFYVFGGRQCGSHTACEGRSDVQIYDPSTDTWSFGTPMTEGCSGMGNAVALDQRIYVIGGEGGSCTGTAVQEYDPAADSWRLVAGLPEAHHGIWPVLLGDPGDGYPDKIDVTGGVPGTSHHHVFAFSCEECPAAPGLAGIGDRDGDEVPDFQDNCPGAPNATQADDDGDMLGDACDPCPGNARNLGTAEGGPCDATSAALFRINAGGGAFSDSLGLSWSADANFSGGSALTTADAISGTADPQIYQSERSGTSFSYSLNAGAAGDYLINLHFAELSHMADGLRIFDVFAPNAADQVIDDLDIHAAVGHDAALVKSVIVHTPDGAIDILATLGATGVDNATLSGIELYRIPQACMADGDCPPGQVCDPTQVCKVIPDTDSDGLDDLSDPCVSDARNLCFGPPAVDAATGNPIRLNAGLSAATCSGTRVDCNGDTWLADFGFNAGNSQECTLPGGCPLDASAVFGCSSAETEDLFQCARKDPASAPELRYSFDVPDGSYLVNLLFMGPSDTATVGSLFFDISIEGELVYEAFDVVEEAGGNGIPLVRSALVTVADGNGLQIEFAHLGGNPTVNGIEVLEVGSPPPRIPRRGGRRKRR